MKLIAAVFLSLFILISCNSMGHRGAVVMKISPSKAHVCMGNQEVSPGEKVNLYEHVCINRSTEYENQVPCEKTKLGEATVTRTINEHYSEIEVPSDVKFKEGTIVEKK